MVLEESEPSRCARPEERSGRKPTYCSRGNFGNRTHTVTGAPPLYSHTWSQRILHFIAGILFGALAIAAAMKLAGRW